MSARNLAVVDDDDRSMMSEEDAQAEAELMAAFSSVREQEKREVATIEVPRYQNVPQRGPDGKLVRDEQGMTVKGPLVLYFHRVAPEFVEELRKKHTHQESRRRAGRTEFTDKLDDLAFSRAVAYAGLLEWCRARYFDDDKLWGNEPVGTGEEFLGVRLRMGELSYCTEAIMALEQLGDERAEQLPKH